MTYFTIRLNPGFNLSEPIDLIKLMIIYANFFFKFSALSYSDDDKSIINGEHTISSSGIYEAAGAIFDYQRIDGITNNSTSSYRKLEGVTEWITCTGRITEAIQLKVFSVLLFL